MLRCTSPSQGRVSAQHVKGRKKHRRANARRPRDHRPTTDLRAFPKFPKRDSRQAAEPAFRPAPIVMTKATLRSALNTLRHPQAAGLTKATATSTTRPRPQPEINLVKSYLPRVPPHHIAINQSCGLHQNIRGRGGGSRKELTAPHVCPTPASLRKALTAVEAIKNGSSGDPYSQFGCR